MLSWLPPTQRMAISSKFKKLIESKSSTNQTPGQQIPNNQRNKPITAPTNKQPTARAQTPSSQSSHDDPLPPSLSDEFYEELQGLHIPLLYIDAQNSMFVHASSNDIYFLVDTGAERSIIPKDEYDVPSTFDVQMTAANGSLVTTYGNCKKAITLGKNRIFEWVFIIADVTQPMLGTDFLKHYNLLIVLRKKKLIDGSQRIQTNSINEPYASLLNRFPNVTSSNHQVIPNTDTVHF